MTNGTAIAQRPAARAYLAGLGVSALLIGAAFAAFGALGTFVAFNGLPFAGHGSGSAEVMIRGENRGAGSAAAAGHRAGGPLGAAAAGPAGAAGAGPRAGGPGGAPSGGVAAGGPGGDSAQVGGGSATGPAGGSGSTPAAPAPPAPASPQSGVVGGTIDSVDSAAANLGINTNLGGSTAPITGPVDQTVTGVLNGAGAALGDPLLGSQTSTAVNGLTGGLLGHGH